MTVDVWMQHPTLRFLGQEMFASLRRWTGQDLPDEDPPVELTLAAMRKPARLARLREQPLELVEGIAPAVVVKLAAGPGPERALR